MNALTTAVASPTALFPAIADAALREALAPPPSADWLSLKAEALEAAAAYSAVCHLSDAVALGREPTDDEDDQVDAASRREIAAINAVIAFAPGDLQTLADKACLLATPGIREPLDGDELAEAFSRDLQTLAVRSTSAKATPVQEWHARAANLRARYEVVEAEEDAKRDARQPEDQPRIDRLITQLTAAEDQLADTPAETMEDVVLKARLAHIHEGHVAADPNYPLAGDDFGTTVARAIVRDLLALGAGLPVEPVAA